MIKSFEKIINIFIPRSQKKNKKLTLKKYQWGNYKEIHLKIENSKIYNYQNWFFKKGQTSEKFNQDKSR